jgi:hypothetical protein
LVVENDFQLWKEEGSAAIAHSQRKIESGASFKNDASKMSMLLKMSMTKNENKTLLSI